jgi:hypothetical protein
MDRRSGSSHHDRPAATPRCCGRVAFTIGPEFLIMDLARVRRDFTAASPAPDLGLLCRRKDHTVSLVS